MKPVLVLASKAFAVALVCNLFFSFAYVASIFLPKDEVIKSLQKSQVSGVLKTPENSIERSTTGWGIDYGTECVALSIDLRESKEMEIAPDYLSRFYDGYLVSGKNVGVFDPCNGLIQLINSPEMSDDQISYARNWWGISVFIQLLIWLIGFASAKAYLYVLMIVTLGLLYFRISKKFSDWKIGIFFLAPMVLYGDFQELHNSFPYSIFTIQLFLMSYIILNLVELKNYNLPKFLITSVTMGAIYNFFFWFNFHLVLTMIPALIFLVLYRVEILTKIYTKILVFLTGFSFGFIFTTLFKWTISVGIFGNEILLTIKDALGLRLSSNSLGINEQLSQYSDVTKNFPLSLRAVIVNLMVFASKFMDPRNSGQVGQILLISFYLFVIILSYRKLRINFDFNISEAVSALPIISIPFIYFILTPNHSFNHATVSYRAIPITLGFIISFIYIMKVRVNRNYKSVS